MDAPQSLIDKAVFRVEQPSPEEGAGHVRHDAGEEEDRAVEGHPLDFLIEQQCESKPENQGDRELNEEKECVSECWPEVVFVCEQPGVVFKPDELWRRQDAVFSKAKSKCDKDRA